ncbi:MAG: aldo/keto reductase [Caldilineaceae bacterium]|nr:aldo/keto reductase [Caldilineaceae bacterium]
MQFKELPGGKTVPAIGLGLWDYGGGSSPDYSRDERDEAAIHSAIEIGYRHFDTAEFYASGHSEELLGRALQRYNRSDFFVTTKVSPSHIRYDDLLAACDRSLQRLQTDYIDLYLIHWPSETIPLAESMRALNRLVTEGKIRHIGVSNFDLPLLKEAALLCETPLATNQVHYNVMHREYVHNGVLAYCQEQGILVTAYSPIKDGTLNNDAVGQVAKRHNASPAQVALQWLIQQPQVITIPKSSNQVRQQENWDAAAVNLSASDIEALNNVA